MKNCLQSLGFRLGFVLSGMMYAVLLLNTQSEVSFAVTAVLALAVMALLVFRFRLQEKLFSEAERWEAAAAGILALASVYTAKSNFYTCCHGWIEKLLTMLHIPGVRLLVRLAPWVAALLALPAVFGYMLWFIRLMVQLVKRLWRQSDYIDRIYFISAAVLFFMIILFTYHCTQAFYGAYFNGIHYDYDLIYSADSGNLVSEDVFRIVGSYQNDMRQPLYGLFAMPFAQLAHLLSLLLWFLPNSYVVLLQTSQMLLFLLASVLLAKMLHVAGAEKGLFYALLSFSYPVLIFVLTVEQYLMAVFWLLLLVYLRKERVSGSLSFVAATGSLLTTGILFPLVTWDRSFRRFVLNTMKLCGVFFAVMILCGRLTALLELSDSLALYQHYSGADVSAMSKLMQYINFAASTLLAPNSQVDNFTYRYHVSYQMVPVTAWRLEGFVVLALAAIGVAVNRRDAFTRICGVWVLYSFLMLGIVGWGTIDNGLLLYSLYFGWAYLALVFQAIDRLFGRVRPVKLAVLFVLLAAMVIINISTLRDAIVFGTQFYPALG